jgi:hypothetical protein
MKIGPGLYQKQYMAIVITKLKHEYSNSCEIT